MDDKQSFCPSIFSTVYRRCFSMFGATLTSWFYIHLIISNSINCDCVQAACADQPIQVIPAAEEQVKVKPAVLLTVSREDYYGCLSDTCSTDTHMDSLKVSSL